MDKRSAAEDALRALVRGAIQDAGLKQKFIAGHLGVSEKHLSQMLTGRVSLTLGWAEAILRMAGQRLALDTQAC
jgi:DNA-binding transcriptional regulator YdaS (Cro superfamily)